MWPSAPTAAVGWLGWRPARRSVRPQPSGSRSGQPQVEPVRQPFRAVTGRASQAAVQGSHRSSQSGSRSGQPQVEPARQPFRAATGRARQAAVQGSHRSSPSGSRSGQPQVEPIRQRCLVCAGSAAPLGALSDHKFKRLYLRRAGQIGSVMRVQFVSDLWAHYIDLPERHVCD